MTEVSQDEHTRDVAIGQFLAEMTYRDVRKILGEPGIDVLVLKGPHLGNAIYDSPTQRPYCDLDLLVRPRDFGEAARRFVAQGYTPAQGDRTRPATDARSYCWTFISRQRVLVELHRALATHDRYPVDVEGLFSRAQPFRFGETEARGLCTEDLLCHLCVHITHSLFWIVEAKHLQDIALLVSKKPVDWGVFVERLTEARCRVGAYYCLLAARDLLGAEAPQPIIETIKPGRFRRWWLERHLDIRHFPAYRHHGHSKTQVQWRLALPLLDRVTDWPRAATAYGGLRLLDLILSITLRPRSGPAAPTP